jgi:hypothetical protein
MNLGQFRAYAYSMVAREGIPATAFSDVAGQNAIIQRALNQYCEETGLLYNAAVPFTPVVNLGTYVTFISPANTSGTIPNSNPLTPYLGSPMATVNQVFLQGQCLFVADDNFGSPFQGNLQPGNTTWPMSGNAKYGPSSELQIIRNYGNYLTASAALPSAFMLKADNQVIFNCPFDQVYGTCYFSGRCFHPALGNDGSELSLGQKDIDLAAMLTSNLYLLPYNRDKAVGEMASTIRPALKAREAELNVKDSSQGYRGVDDGIQRVNLGWGPSWPYR